MPYVLSKKQVDLLRNPTTEGAMEFWRYDLLGEPATPDTPLAGLHMARLNWGGSTKEMRMESERWLLDHDFPLED